MLRIGLLSDTHGWWDEKYVTYFESCDEIWHAGDIGSESVAERLSEIKPLRAVCGNIDGVALQLMYPRVDQFTVENINVMMKHIGGYPGHYDPVTAYELSQSKPKLFIAGHTHIVRIIYDEKYGCLHINPGAAGWSGRHHVRTLVRFTIDGDEIKDPEIIELGVN